MVRKLTKRENQILSALAEGKTSKQIAEHLSISIRTVEAHRNNISNKLNISGLANLIKYAIREGLATV